LSIDLGLELLFLLLRSFELIFFLYEFFADPGIEFLELFGFVFQVGDVLDEFLLVA